MSLEGVKVCEREHKGMGNTFPSSSPESFGRFQTNLVGIIRRVGTQSFLYRGMWLLRGQVEGSMGKREQIIQKSSSPYPNLVESRFVLPSYIKIWVVYNKA